MRALLTQPILRRPSASALTTLSLLRTRYPPSKCRCPAPLRRPRVSLQQRRTFFHLFGKPPRALRPPEIEPGWESIMAWHRARIESLRPPARRHMMEAFRAFFMHKEREGLAVNSTQAGFLVQLMRYIVENEAEEEGGDLPLEVLVLARRTLRYAPGDEGCENHLELASRLWAETVRLQRSKGAVSESKDAPQEGESAVDEDQEAAAELAPDAKLDFESIKEEDFRHYIGQLSDWGGSATAAELVRQYYEQADADAIEGESLWLPVLRGLAAEGRETELLETHKKARASGHGFESEADKLKIHSIMTCFYAGDHSLGYKQGLKELKSWFFNYLHESVVALPETYQRLLDFAIRHEKKVQVAIFFDKLFAKDPATIPGPVFDVMLQWAVYAKGKSRLEVEQMISDRAAADVPGEEMWPSTATINGLVRISCAVNDEALARSFLQTGERLSVLANAATYAPLIDFQIENGKVGDALASYRLMKRNSWAGDEDSFENLAATNKLLRALVAGETPDFDNISIITTDLMERRQVLEAETVVALSLQYLRYEMAHDVLDTLNLNVYQLNGSQFTAVQEAYVDFCLDRRNSMARVWDAYQIVRQFFVDITVEDRLRIMHMFFDRKRPDLAAQVVSHMSRHHITDFHPTDAVYVEFFERIADRPSKEALMKVHNLMKLDQRLQMNTRLYNALAMAVGSCGAAWRAMDYWNDVERSAEGPSLNSVEIALWLCLQLEEEGAKQARRIWKRLVGADVDMTPGVYLRYAAVLGAGHRLAEALEILERMRAATGQHPDANGLGTLFNALDSFEDQKRFEKWARLKCPEAWAQIQKKFKVKYPWKEVFPKIPHGLKA